MKRSLQQVRPGDDPNAMVYAPQRDLVNIYVPMMREVFAGLDQDNWAEPMKSMLEAAGVTQEQVSVTVAVLTEAHRLYVRDAEVDTPAFALAKAAEGHDLHPLARIAFFERVGVVVMGGFFVALRDVTMRGQPSHIHADFTSMIAAGRATAARLSGHESKELDDDTEYRLRAEVEELQRVLTQSTEDARKLVTTTADQVNNLKEQKGKLENQLEVVREVAKADAAKLEKLYGLRAYIKELREAGWLRRLWMAVKLAFYIYTGRKL